MKVVTVVTVETVVTVVTVVTTTTKNLFHQNNISKKTVALEPQVDYKKSLLKSTVS